MRLFFQVKSIAHKYLAKDTVAALRRGGAWLTLCLPLMRISDLEVLASLHQAEKEKGFLRPYTTFFAPLRKRSINLLEIGIGGAGNPHKGGGSLRMWRCFFPHGKIFGIDLYDKTPQNEPGRIRTFRGDQSDATFLRQVATEIGRLDIVIDDGSHRNPDVIQSFETLFPLLADGGIYVIEDLQTSYWQAYGGSSENADATGTTMSMLKRLTDGLNYQEYEVDDYRPNYYDEHVVGIYSGHNIAFIFKGDNTTGSNILGKR